MIEKEKEREIGKGKTEKNKEIWINREINNLKGIKSTNKQILPDKSICFQTVIILKHPKNGNITVQTKVSPNNNYTI